MPFRGASFFLSFWEAACVSLPAAAFGRRAKRRGGEHTSPGVRKKIKKKKRVLTLVQHKGIKLTSKGFENLRGQLPKSPPYLK